MISLNDDDVLDSKPATNGKTTKSKLFLHLDSGEGLKKELRIFCKLAKNIFIPQQSKSHLEESLKMQKRALFEKWDFARHWLKICSWNITKHPQNSGWKYLLGLLVWLTPILEILNIVINLRNIVPWNYFWGLLRAFTYITHSNPQPPVISSFTSSLISTLTDNYHRRRVPLSKRWAGKNIKC